LVYNDGSTDKTAAVAKLAGADYVFSHKKNLGLARTFRDAVKEALKAGANIIVNTDADNQYDQAEIAKLIAPIVEGRADLVSGNREVAKLAHMPPSKKYGNLLGSMMIRLLTGSRVEDASSGFRAFTREVAQKVHVFSTHTYTHETLIGAYFREFVIVEVPVTFRKRTTGDSRLIAGGVGKHILKSGATILRAVLLYRALAVFSYLGGAFILLGAFGVGRFFYFALVEGKAGGHIQSLVISSIMFAVGFNILVVGFIADLVSYNRKILEEK
jgi:glycosyltransferase involved in cell wall biosynthesis